MADPKATSNKSSETNERVLKFLEGYIAMGPDPGYAILINGDWGSGKTWFINHFQKKMGEERFLYVSLYGVTKIAQIEDQFFRKLHPVLASKPFSIGTSFIQTCLRLGLKINYDDKKHDEETVSLDLAKFNVKKFLSDTENKILIFDDLERCEMPIERTLGYINTFVEHRGKKVILLANEKEVNDQGNYQKKGEKLVGKRISLIAEVEKALTAFLTEISNLPCQEVLQKNQALIASIFAERKHQNLRTLRQAALEYERFFSSMPEKAQEHSEFQKACIVSFFCLSIAIRSGKFKPEKIRGLAKRLYSNEVRVVTKGADGLDTEIGETDNPDTQVLTARFNPENLSPSEECLYNFFEFGHCPEDLMADAILSSSFFKTDETPDWMKLWRFWSLADDEFEKLFSEVENKFYDGKFIEEGELKHICGILLKCTRQGIVERNFGDTVKKVGAQVKKQLESSAINLMYLRDERRAYYHDAYKGLQYHEIKSDELREIFQAIDDFRARQAAQKIRSTASEILKWMRDEPSRLGEELLHNGVGVSDFKLCPVLHHLNVEDFLKAFIDMEPGRRYNLTHILNKRYEALNIAPVMVEELDWLKALEAKSMAMIKTLRQPTRIALSELVEHGVTPAITQLTEFKSRKAE